MDVLVDIPEEETESLLREREGNGLAIALAPAPTTASLIPEKVREGQGL
jgi:hypothetical protein